MAAARFPTRTSAASPWSPTASLAWVHNRFYTWHEAGHLGKTPRRSAAQPCPVKRDGVYRIELWDTRTGKGRRDRHGDLVGLGCQLALPPIEKDVALKVIHQPGS